MDHRQPHHGQEGDRQIAASGADPSAFLQPADRLFDDAATPSTATFAGLLRDQFGRIDPVRERTEASKPEISIGVGRGRRACAHANLHHVERAARAAHRRYLEALSAVNDPAPSYCKVERLAERQVVAQRSYAGFNPARRDDVRLFAAVLDGNNLLRGFRNSDIRERIFPAVQDPFLG